MLEAYSLNVAVASDSAVPFNSTSVLKGCTATHPSANTFELNKCGVYKVSFDASLTGSTTLQLFKNGVAQPQAQATGANPSFTTLVQVSENNSCCCCSSPTTIQIMNTGSEATLANANIVIDKLC